MMLRFGAATDRGRVRPRNEDRFIANAELGIFAVVDGMGGHAGGEFASATISEAIASFISESGTDSDMTLPGEMNARLSPIVNRLQMAVRVANRTLAARVREKREPETSGATMAAALFGDGQVAVAHVGDCRVYLLEGTTISAVTQDHSLVAEQVAQGLIDEESAKTHPLRHVVTRAVSGQNGITVDTVEFSVLPGTRLILCSDGIHGVLTDKEIAALMSAPAPSLDDVCRAAIAAVNARGGPDNATVVVVEAGR
ncbi:MAG: serine/threonine-protein phosphatase [Acidobacteria bacterium]|nr:serine/threonine-protein phosphatase [Acidobacteriota bacterium]